MEGCYKISKEAVDQLNRNIHVENFVIPPDFIKIDIEGAEGKALRGFANKIDENKPLLFIELHTPEQDREVGNFLMHHQYVAYRLTDGSTENDLEIEGLKKIKDLSKTHPHPDGIWGNILAVHPQRVSGFIK